MLQILGSAQMTVTAATVVLPYMAALMCTNNNMGKSEGYQDVQ
jgi:hypothetical protein